MMFFLVTFKELLKEICVGVKQSVTKYSTTSLLAGSNFKIWFMSMVHGSPVLLFIEHTTLCVGTFTNRVGAFFQSQRRNALQCFDPALFWLVTLTMQKVKTQIIIWWYPFISNARERRSGHDYLNWIKHAAVNFAAIHVQYLSPVLFSSVSSKLTMINVMFQQCWSVSARECLSVNTTWSPSIFPFVLLGLKIQMTWFTWWFAWWYLYFSFQTVSDDNMNKHL